MGFKFEISHVGFKTTQYGVIALPQFGVFHNMGVPCNQERPLDDTKSALVAVIRQSVGSVPALSHAFWIAYVEKALVLNQCFYM